ncbi:MAG: hypothetical protein NWQ55_04260 [Salibacteraceae bacterium]|jgi:hypothetical protein|nr:hypothetical protein [Salibacteraceae bacterium]MDP4686123.1 hypothetical protein [Salibacteraceae bacterium]MDP4763309.1 hypothetical protein [Salibacteraceae bacterium]MDP4843868.1 hypothetical protein [Salibacteraceae bacterium]MDP4933997.1 hypothetical protein [Salibacteraceae bacterium]
MNAGAGFISQMVSSMKSNSGLRSNRSFLRSRDGFEGRLSSKQLTYTLASPELLKAIKTELREERAKQKKKQLIAFVISFAIMLISIFALAKAIMWIIFEQ